MEPTIPTGEKAIEVKKEDPGRYLAEDFSFIPESLIEEVDTKMEDVYRNRD